MASTTEPEPIIVDVAKASSSTYGEPSSTARGDGKRANSTVTETNQKVSSTNEPWSSLFTISSLPGRVNLSREEDVFADGKLLLNGSLEEIEEGAAHWHNSLVGYFIGWQPSFRTIKTRAEAMWKPTGAMEVLSLPLGFFIFRFGLGKDKSKILEGGLWFVQNTLLILKPWDIDTKLEKVDLSTIPVWVKIYNLPLFL